MVLLVLALGAAGPAPASGQLLPTLPTTTTVAPPTQPPTTAAPTTTPATAQPVPTVTAATTPTTARPRTTTTTAPASTTSSTEVPTTPAPTTVPPETTPVTTAIGPIEVRHASYPWLPLLVTLCAFGAAVGILAAPTLAERARHHPTATEPARAVAATRARLAGRVPPWRRPAARDDVPSVDGPGRPGRRNRPERSDPAATATTELRPARGDAEDGPAGTRTGAARIAAAVRPDPAPPTASGNAARPAGDPPAGEAAGGSRRATGGTPGGEAAPVGGPPGGEAADAKVTRRGPRLARTARPPRAPKPPRPPVAPSADHVWGAVPEGRVPSDDPLADRPDVARRPPRRSARQKPEN
ncbi:MAG TPA: hypothetical protein VHM89_10555 [Acidimicrobiales bacterium]|nr:hypothetical protein [Acidimicrobiales bacterium]